MGNKKNTDLESHLVESLLSENEEETEVPVWADS